MTTLRRDCNGLQVHESWLRCPAPQPPLATAIAAAPPALAFRRSRDRHGIAKSVRASDNTGNLTTACTESADDRTLATPNNNDGDHNFKDAGDAVTTRFDLLTELDVVNKGQHRFSRQRRQLV